MRKLVALLVLVSTVSFAQKNKTGWDSAKLKGKVKTYRVLDYQFDEQGKPQRGAYEAFTEYDNTGKIKKMIIQNTDVYLAYTDTYDVDGKLLESVSRDKNDSIVISVDESFELSLGPSFLFSVVPFEELLLELLLPDDLLSFLEEFFFDEL